ncbi:MAG: GNVR domain-containing protein, partial [Bacteroidota bacterium]
DTPEEDLEEALKCLRKLMSAQHDVKTKTVTITLEMREPQLAADVLNMLVQEVDRFIREERTTSASEQVKWISERLAEVEEELRAAEDSLTDFRERNRRVIDSPELLLQQARLQREVTVKSTIFIELKKQRELAEIEEIKNVSIVNVLDKARAPVKKVRPKRATNSGIVFLLSVVLLSAYYGLRPFYGDRVSEFWQRLKSEGR